MQYEVNFGQIGQKQRTPASTTRFRLAILGDFSGRANAGLLETGAALAKRKPIAIDVDNLDDVLARFKLTLQLPIGEDGATVEVAIGSMDDFHPDQLVENVELFETLLKLRRDLGSKAGFARASKEVLSWSGEDALPRAAGAGRGAAVATDLKLGDFARLTGRKPKAAEAADVDDLVRRLVGPFVQASRDPQADQLIAQVDAALSAAMRRVLHHPDFQAAESLWRSLDLLTRRIETGAKLQLVVYDVSAEEWAADLAATDALEETGLYGMLVEQPTLDADQGALSAVIGLYGLELSPPHADLLGRMAQIAATARVPFIASIEADALQTPMHEQHALIREAWTALQSLSAAQYLGLAAVRFLLRMPYGRKSDPIDAFKFEEFTRESGLSGMLWANPAVAVGLLLAQGWSKAGAKMVPGTPSVIGEMPYYVYAAPDGDQVALPCTERLWSERQVAKASQYHVMPVVSLRGRPEIRLAGCTSLFGAVIAGPWAPAGVTPRAAPVASAPAEAPAVAAAEEPAAEAETTDLDALLASLETPVAEAAPALDAGADADIDLDALLASLSEEKPPAAEGETEVDLDALLASL